MNNTICAGARICAKNRITRHVVADYVYQAILEETGKQVGILSAEKLTKGWADERAGSNKFQVWRAEVADSGQVYSLHVTLTKNPQGSLIGADIKS